MPIYDNDGTSNYEIGKIYDNNGTTINEIGKVYDNNGVLDSEIWSADLLVAPNPIEFPISNYKSVSGGRVAFNENNHPYVIVDQKSGQNVAKGMYITINVDGYKNCKFRYVLSEWSGFGNNKLSAGFSYTQSPVYNNLYDGWPGTTIDRMHNINVTGQKVLTLFVGSSGHVAGYDTTMAGYMYEIFLT